MTRPQPSARADYPFFTRLHTRWDDNDIYGHLNNTVHYKLMDTAVNGWLLDHVGLDPHHGATIYPSSRRDAAISPSSAIRRRSMWGCR